MKQTLTATFLLLALHAFCQHQNSITFFDVKPATDTPQLFAEGIVDDALGNRDMAISPTGDEMFFTLQTMAGNVNVILHSRKVNNHWTKPEVATFSGMYGDLEPAFSPDGKRLYFSSNRPLHDSGAKKDFDIWFVTKQGNDWVQPTNLGAPVNTNENEFYASVAKTGNIYFTRAIPEREEDILICKWVNGAYNEAESLPDAINSKNDEFNAFVDPDEKYILFSVYGRKDDYGRGDIYLSKKDSNNNWLPAVNLGALINSPATDYCPYITPDKKYFFFTSNKNNITIPFKEKQTIGSLQRLLNSAVNGSDNIYWMKADAILK